MAIPRQVNRVWVSCGIVAAVIGSQAPISRSYSHLCSQGPTGIAVPEGFCSTVFADGLGLARHIAVTPAGDVFVILDRVRSQAPTGAIIALRDVDGDGVAERREGFGTSAGDDIEWTDGYLYYSTSSQIARYRLALGELLPASEPELVVGPFVKFETPEHDSKPFVLTQREMFVHVGAPSNSCQRENRRAGSTGVDPCPLLENTAGIWRFDRQKLHQLPQEGRRVATGIRHTLGLSVHPTSGALFAVMHGRDLLHLNWPGIFSEEDNADLPSDELLKITNNADYGWPTAITIRGGTKEFSRRSMAATAQRSGVVPSILCQHLPFQPTQRLAISFSTRVGCFHRHTRAVLLWRSMGDGGGRRLNNVAIQFLFCPLTTISNPAAELRSLPRALQM